MGLFRRLSYTTEDHLPKGGTTPPLVVRVLQHQSLLKKIPFKTSLRADLMEAFSHLRFLFRENASLHRGVDKINQCVQ